MTQEIMVLATKLQSPGSHMGKGRTSSQKSALHAYLGMYVHTDTHTHSHRCNKKYLCILLLLGRMAHYSLFQARSFLNIRIQFPHLQSLTACWVVFSSSSPYSAQPHTWDFSLICPDTLNSPRYIISSQQAAKIQHPLTTPT